MAVMKVMSQIEGHKTLEWDTKEDLDSQRVELARDEFERLVNSEGFVAFEIEEKNGKREGTQIEEFDAELDEILLMAPMAGG